MTRIEDWAAHSYLDETDETWDKYRDMVRAGVSTAAEIQVRDLFQELSLVQSHAEMRVSVLEARRDKAKLHLHLTQISLLRIHTVGAMNKRMADVENDQAYRDDMKILDEAEDELTIAKGSAKAATIAAGALSRELSMRSKL